MAASPKSSLKSSPPPLPIQPTPRPLTHGLSPTSSQALTPRQTGPLRSARFLHHTPRLSQRCLMSMMASFAVRWSLRRGWVRSSLLRSNMQTSRRRISILLIVVERSSCVANGDVVVFLGCFWMEMLHRCYIVVVEV